MTQPQAVAEMKGMLRRKEGLARGTVSATQTRLVLLQDLMKHPSIGPLFCRPQLARYGPWHRSLAELSHACVFLQPISPIFAQCVPPSPPPTQPSSGLASSVLCLVQRLFGESSESYTTHNAAEFGWDKGALVTNIFQCLLALPPASTDFVHPVIQAIAEDTEFSAVAFQDALKMLLERCEGKKQGQAKGVKKSCCQMHLSFVCSAVIDIAACPSSLP